MYAVVSTKRFFIVHLPFSLRFFLFRCDDELKGKLPLFRVAKVCMYLSIAIQAKYVELIQISNKPDTFFDLYLVELEKRSSWFPMTDIF